MSKEIRNKAPNNNFEQLDATIREILNRRLSGIENPILKELVTTEFVKEFLASLHNEGFVTSFRYRLEIEDEESKELNQK